MQAEIPLIETRAGYLTDPSGPAHIYAELENCLVGYAGDERWERGWTLCGRSTSGIENEGPMVWRFASRPTIDLCKTCNLRFRRGFGQTTLSRHEYEAAA